MTNSFLIENDVLKSYTGTLGDVVVPDSVTQIGELAFHRCNSLTIYGAAGSVAQRYAEEHGNPFVAE